jgi:sulfur-oxidizing protein SoxX
MRSPTRLQAQGETPRAGGQSSSIVRPGLCLLCHSGPFPEERFQGTIGPDLNGVATRLSEGQIRLRIVDPARTNADSVMPAYFRTEGLTRVAPSLRGKPILSAEQIEDVVAFLVTLK